MNDLQKMIEIETNKENLKKLKYALYLYKDLLKDDNQDLLDDYTQTLIELFQGTNMSSKDRKFNYIISEKFNKYLINNGKTEKTSYDYVKRVERICKELKISIEELAFGKTDYSINRLIDMYSTGDKSEENINKHNGPLSALKQFRNFLDDEEINLNEFDNVHFYLCETEGYQSFEVMDKHPYKIEIDGKKCHITYKKDRVIFERENFIINDDNYYALLYVFKKYKSILSKDTTPAFISFPHGGNHTYNYTFDDVSNNSECASLFQSEDSNMVKRAYKEYYEIINKIIEQ